MDKEQIIKVIQKELQTKNITIQHISYMQCYERYFVQATINNKKSDLTIAAKLLNVEDATFQIDTMSGTHEHNHTTQNP